ncbi:hypothetical protein D9M70_307800 [compost metagenome]
MSWAKRWRLAANCSAPYANHVPHAQHRGLVIAADLCLDLALGVILHERVVSLAK